MPELPLAPEPADLKARLSLAYVCARLGVDLDRSGYARCPFHDDDRPSFYLWDGDDGNSRWWCQVCGFGGDLFDLIMRLRGVPFPEALGVAAAMLDELPPGYEPPRRGPAPTHHTPEDWTAEVAAARARAAEPGCAGLMSAQVGLAPSDDHDLCARWDVYLRETWGWGIDAASTIYMPHFSPEGELTGCKLRDGYGSKQSLPGSRFEHLYGSWLGRRHRAALVCEGETDAVWAGWAAAQARVPVDVFALPSGAQKPVDARWLTFLERAVVYLALDPDEAGVAATRRWLESLATAGFLEVRVCCLPLGRDLRSARPSLPDLVSRARRPLPEPAGVSVAPGGYVRTDAQGNMRQATTWTVEPTAQLVGDESGFDVVLSERGTSEEATLRLSDLASAPKLNQWANRHRTLFTGNDTDRQRIAELVQARGAVTPEIFATDRVGMHDPPPGYEALGPSVVYPGGYVGKVPWRYLPRERAADVSGRVLLPVRGEYQRFSWSWLESFLALSEPAVMHPVLAWLAASARRPEAGRFPVLFVGGSSGAGKSTIAELALRLMGSRIEMGLGSATPFVLLRTLAASTSLPVFVDEWTRVGRRDAREALQSAIPDLYVKGLMERGQADLSVSSYRMTAPTIVAGEDVFALDRERERMVTVWPSRSTQDHDALAVLAGAPIERFGDMYHRWLAASPRDLPTLHSDADDRPGHNRHVLLAGWGTLLAFLRVCADYGEPVPSLPLEPDLSGLDRAYQGDEENVYETALHVGATMSDQDHVPVCWSDPEGRGTWVRAHALVGLIETRRVDVELPGRSRAMLNYFRERYPAVSEAQVTPPLGTHTTRAHLVYGFYVQPSALPPDEVG